MYKVVYSYNSNVQFIDELFETEQEALDELWEVVQHMVQYNQTGDYDPDVEFTYYSVVEA